MISTFFYSNKQKQIKTDLTRPELFSALAEKEGLLWVDLEDPSEFESDCLVEIFNFHPLAVEDCLSDHSEPKLDDYDEYFFIVMHSAMTKRDEAIGNEELASSQFNIFFGKNYVVTFHKMPIKAIQNVREVLRKKPDRFMGQGSDMLLHAILDHFVDNYQPLLGQYDRRIDKLEVELYNDPPKNYLASVMQVKQDVFSLRRIIGPQRDMLNNFTRTASDFIHPDHVMYFRDVYDHLFRIYGMVESFHENLTSILQAYYSYSSHKLNEVVKHLTALATLTMPAVIIASFYGMNFDHMPELHWKLGYPFSILLALGISAAMLLWMKSKKWI